MKKLIFITIFFTNIVTSQNITEIDSIANNICNHLEEISNIKNDTLKIDTLYKNKLYPYLYSIEQKNQESVGNKIYFRLQRNCVGFRNLLNRLDPPAIDSGRRYDKPKSKITKSDLKIFKKLNQLYYYELDGKLTKSSFENGYWIDNFSDGTYSKLYFKWINDTTFELKFIESNNESRSNLSVPGDKYVYEILNKGNGYFKASMNIPGQKVYEEFKFYFK